MRKKELEYLRSVSFSWAGKCSKGIDQFPAGNTFKRTTISRNSSLSASDKVYVRFGVFGQGIPVYKLRPRNLQDFVAFSSFLPYSIIQS